MEVPPPPLHHRKEWKLQYEKQTPLGNQRACLLMHRDGLKFN
jgi:hypothetical protein